MRRAGGREGGDRRGVALAQRGGQGTLGNRPAFHRSDGDDVLDRVGEEDLGRERTARSASCADVRILEPRGRRAAGAPSARVMPGRIPDESGGVTSSPSHAPRTRCSPRPRAPRPARRDEQRLVGAARRALPRARGGRRAGSWSCSAPSGPGLERTLRDDHARGAGARARATAAPRAARPRSSAPVRVGPPAGDAARHA